MGFIGHGISVYDELSALENLMLFGKLYALPNIRTSGAMEWLERTGLERVNDGLVREFSRGMRQRLAVARAFLHEPDGAAAGRALHGARRPRHRGAAATAARGAARTARPSSCPPTSCGKRWNWPRTSRCSIAARWHFTARARRRWWPTRAGCIAHYGEG